MMKTPEPQLEAASAKWLRGCGSAKQLAFKNKLLATYVAPFRFRCLNGTGRGYAGPFGPGNPGNLVCSVNNFGFDLTP